jgi:hypothetical protein
VTGAVVAGLLELPLLGYSLIVGGMRCDESCNENLSPSVRLDGWSHWDGSWQWKAIVVLPLLAALLTFVAGALAVAGRSFHALVALLLILIPVVAWIAILAWA